MSTSIRKKSDRLVQSTFKPSSKSSTCKICGMTYLQLAKDQQVHQKYHKTFVSGIAWPVSFQDTALCTVNIRQAPADPKDPSKLIPVKFQLVDKKSSKQVQKVEKILQMVQTELNAPLDSQSWKSVEQSGRAFVAIYDDKVIAVVTTDPIDSVESQCKWMIYKSQTIVPNQINTNIRIGISRIWTATNYRRLGIANHLLQCVLQHSIYGVMLQKQQIGFSQPSTQGGLLAKSFNGALHKSGEVLIPVYIER